MCVEPNNPDYGRRLLASELDHRAEIDGSSIYARVPLTTSPLDGFRNITYGSLKTAVDRCAHFLDKQVGPVKSNGSLTLAWVSWPQDIRYVLLALAAMKTGHRVFLPSSKNSNAAYHALLDECSCRIFLRPVTAQLPIVNTLVRERSMRVVVVPDYEYFFDGSTENSQPYPFAKSFEDARFDECLVLHTSGSTGIPKTVAIKQGYFSAVDAYHLLPALGAAPVAFSRFERSTCFAPFPLFHAAGLIVHLAGALFWNVILVMGSSAPLTADTVREYLDHGGIDTAFLPGAILVDISNDDGLLDRMAALKYVGFGGSPLPERAGWQLSQKTRLVNLIGTTESAKLPSEVTEGEDWQFLRFGCNTGFEFRPVDGTDEYEMVIRRDKKSFDLLQGVFVTFPDLQEWHTRDLYTRHPSKPDHWKYERRLDDIVVFSTGEKLNPLTLEDTVASHAGVAGAVVAGSGKFQACLLVEPSEALGGDADRQRFLNELWPAVQRANAQTVAHGRIDRHLMLTVTPDKPLPRAGKGSIQRRLALQRYEQEIESLYEQQQQQQSSIPRDGEDRLDFSSEAAAIASLKAVFAQTTADGWEAPAEDADMFAYGIDSVQVIGAVRRINRALGSATATPQAVYTSGTLRRLAQSLRAALSNSGPCAPTRGEQIDAIVERFACDLPLTARPATKPDCYVVALTGSTGSLGSYLLDALLAAPHVVHIYCLNRSLDSRAAQAKDFSRAYLGLTLEWYRNLLGNVTHVIHNAWEVNFNLALDSFTDTHVRGVRGLVDLSARSKYGAHIYFLSSIGAVQGLLSGHSDGPISVPEEILKDSSAPSQMGYSESKHVGERLLAHASGDGGVPSTVCRVGQIAGPVRRGLRGMWNKREWLPSLVISSGTMGDVPESLGRMDEVDWLPVDVLGELVVDLTLQQKAGSEAAQVEVHHLVNPRRCKWSGGLAQAVASLQGARLVSLAEWVEKVKGLASNADIDLEKNPAVKLLTFFEEMASGVQSSAAAKSLVMDTSGTRKKSCMLRDVEPVSKEWMELWMRQWGI